MGFNYLVLSLKRDGVEYQMPIIYPDKLVHSAVAAAMCQVLVDHLPGATATPVSAGQIEISVDSCSGQSTSLDLASRGEEDEHLIDGFPYFHGIT